MKTCPYCAEEIQDAAVVCKHCGRDLVSTSTAQKVEIVQPAKKTGCFTWLVAITLGFFVLVWIVSAINPRPAATRTSSPLPPVQCQVTADPPSFKAAAEQWCGMGVFTKVDVKSNNTTFTAALQFSPGGYARFQGSNGLAMMNAFRQMTDEMASRADANVAISLHGPNGDMVGGCARARSQRESLCKP